jgi:hypothetical protein
LNGAEIFSLWKNNALGMAAQAPIISTVAMVATAWLAEMESTPSSAEMVMTRLS